MRGRPLREADLTLEKAIDICRACEITYSQVKALSEEVEVNRIIRVKSKDNKVEANPVNLEQKETSCFKHGEKKSLAIGRTCKSFQEKSIYKDVKITGSAPAWEE